MKPVRQFNIKVSGKQRGSIMLLMPAVLTYFVWVFVVIVELSDSAYQKLVHRQYAENVASLLTNHHLHRPEWYLYFKAHQFQDSYPVTDEFDYNVFQLIERGEWDKKKKRFYAGSPDINAVRVVSAIEIPYWAAALRPPNGGGGYSNTYFWETEVIVLRADYADTPTVVFYQE